MKTALSIALVGLIGLWAPSVLGDQQSVTFGGDAYAVGQDASISAPVAHDAFQAGSTVVLTVPVDADAHLAGFDVQSSANVGGNLYAAGFSVSIGGSVHGDVTALGNTVSVHTSQPITGNVRAAAATFTLDSHASGSVLVTAATATINARIDGDFSFYGRNLVFGPNATVAGQVLVHAPAPIAIPATVAPADRVVFTQLTSPEYPTEVGQTAEMLAKGFWATLWATTLWWLLLLLAGIAFIALHARLIGSLETLSTVRPFRRLGLGVLAFATVVGLVPVVALTLVGLLLIPFVLVFVLIACSLAYVAGVYLIGRAIGVRFRALATTEWKIASLIVSLLVAGLLGTIPFIGWLIGLSITAYGFGVFAALIMTRWSSDDHVLLTAPASKVGAPSAGTAAI